MRVPERSETIQVPDDVQLTIDGRRVTAKGAKGMLMRDFSHVPIQLEIKGKTVKIWAEWPRKKDSALVGTIRSHIQNMITGVTKGFTYKLKIVFSHLTVTLAVTVRCV